MDHQRFTGGKSCWEWLCCGETFTWACILLDIRALHQYAHKCIPKKPGFNASAVCRPCSSTPAWWKEQSMLSSWERIPQRYHWCSVAPHYPGTGRLQLSQALLCFWAVSFEPRWRTGSSLKLWCIFPTPWQRRQQKQVTYVLTCLRFAELVALRVVGTKLQVHTETIQRWDTPGLKL